jgi:hypothetical protein
MSEAERKTADRGRTTPYGREVVLPSDSVKVSVCRMALRFDRFVVSRPGAALPHGLNLRSLSRLRRSFLEGKVAHLKGERGTFSANMFRAELPPRLSQHGQRKVPSGRNRRARWFPICVRWAI